MNKLVKKIVAGAVITALVAGNALVAIAAPITTTSNVMSTLGINDASTHNITFTIPNAVPAAGTITLTFPSDFNFTGVVTGDVSATGAPTVGLSGTQNRIITLTYAGGTAAGVKNVTIGGSLALNATTTGVKSIALATSAGDSGAVAVYLVTDDQVVVTANVNQTLNFAVSDNTIGFGDLASGSIRYATGDTLGTGAEPTNAHTLTAGTNGTGGYTVSARGDTLSANGGADTITRIADATAPTAGTEQFGFDVDYASGGSAPTVSAPFDDYGMTDVAATAEPIATQAGPTADNIFDVNYTANITAVTEAGAYTTTMTYTMSANF